MVRRKEREKDVGGGGVEWDLVGWELFMWKFLPQRGTGSEGDSLIIMALRQINL